MGYIISGAIPISDVKLEGFGTRGVPIGGLERHTRVSGAVNIVSVIVNKAVISTQTLHTFFITQSIGIFFNTTFFNA